MKIGKIYYSLATDYASLVGKYVTMERYAEPGDAEFEIGSDVGMEGIIAYVRDCVEEIEPAVEIMTEYGMGFKVFPQQHEWRFTIWASQEVREQFRGS